MSEVREDYINRIKLSRKKGGVMQNWKIKRMPGKRINEWLKAIGFLLGHYVKHKDTYSCPFCDIATNCLNCLWEIFEHKDCFDFQGELKLEGSMSKVRNCIKWQTARIPMLRRWKKILQTEKERRKG